MSPIQQIRHPRDSIRGEWIDELDAAQALAVLHILAEDRGAAGLSRRGPNHCVPEGQPMLMDRVDSVDQGRLVGGDDIALR
jgi:hypothetical protein